MKYKIDQEIQYRTTDKDNNEVWRDGTIYAIRTQEAQKQNKVLETTYLVTTGKAAHVQKMQVNPRDLEMSERVNALVDKGQDIVKATAAVDKHTDLPKSKIETLEIVQPQQIEVLPENIRAVK